MATCVFCHTEIREGALTCPNCGDSTLLDVLEKPKSRLQDWIDATDRSANQEALRDIATHVYGAVILEGNGGGIIYATCPASLVRCSEGVLQDLLRDIDAALHNETSGESGHVVRERLSVGERVPGGMGGGVIMQDVWVHPELVKLRLADDIKDVMLGRKFRITKEPNA